MNCPQCGLATELTSEVFEPLGLCRACWRAQRQAAWNVYRAHRRLGLLVPPETCEVEGCDRTDVVGHHADYRRPLDVAFVCNKHHARLHREAERRAGSGQRW